MWASLNNQKINKQHPHNVRFSSTNSRRSVRPLHSVKKKPVSPARKYRAVDSHCGSKKFIPFSNPECLSLCLQEATIGPILRQVKPVDSSEFVMSKLILSCNV